MATRAPAAKKAAPRRRRTGQEGRAGEEGAREEGAPPRRRRPRRRPPRRRPPRRRAKKAPAKKAPAKKAPRRRPRRRRRPPRRPRRPRRRPRRRRPPRRRRRQEGAGQEGGRQGVGGQVAVLGVVAGQAGGSRCSTSGPSTCARPRASRPRPTRWSPTSSRATCSSTRSRGEGDTLSIERERDLTLSAQARAAVEEIDHALAKFALGTYGICEVSGRPDPEGAARGHPVGTRAGRVQGRRASAAAEVVPADRSTDDATPRDVADAAPAPRRSSPLGLVAAIGPRPGRPAHQVVGAQPRSPTATSSTSSGRCASTSLQHRRGVQPGQRGGLGPWISVLAIGVVVGRARSAPPAASRSARWPPGLIAGGARRQPRSTGPSAATTASCTAR